MKIYIAGPMSGHENWNFPAFFEAEEQLKALGHTVINPAHNDGETIEEALKSAGNPERPNNSWAYYMRRDLPSVMAVEAICVLPGWQNSKGATLEVQVAEAIGLPLYVLKGGRLVPRITIVGLSGWARSGKDTAAAYLVENHGFTRMSFAAPMKEALYRLNPRITINNVIGTPIRTGVDIYGWDDLKEHGPEVRELLQRFGTEVGREMFGKDFWVDQAIRNSPDGSKVVVSDVRYPNEADAIKALGGSVWRINRLGVFAANDHASEHALDDYDFTGTIENSSSISELNRQLEEVLLNGEAIRA
jgi:hypothetical protein